MNLDKVGARRLVLSLQQHIEATIYQYDGKINDSTTRYHVAADIGAFGDELINRKAICDYTVVCDETNNPPSIIDNGELMVDVYFKQHRSIDIIHIRTIPIDDIISAFEYAMKVVEPKY